MGTTPIKTYLEPELARAVSRLADAQGRSESAVIAEAVRTRLSASAESAVKAESDGLKRQLNRIDARLDKVVWEQMQLKECVLLFVRVWLEYNPQLDPQHEESAAASAEARFERFLDLISNNLTSGQALGDLDVRIGVAPSAANGHDEGTEAER